MSVLYFVQRLEMPFVVLSSLCSLRDLNANEENPPCGKHLAEQIVVQFLKACISMVLPLLPR